MGKLFRRFLFTAFAAIAGRAAAQDRAADTSSAKPASSARRSSPVMVAVIGGPGVETPTPYYFVDQGFLYQTQKRPMVFELELSKAIRASGGKNTFFEYFVAVQPAISVGGNVKYLFRPCLSHSCLKSGVDLVEQRYTAYGIGITPFGGRVTTRLPAGAKFSVALGAGAVALNRAIPYEKAKSFNFQLTARPAIGLPIRNHGTLWAGCEFLHVSNANTSPINPGINARLFMFGFQRGH